MMQCRLFVAFLIFFGLLISSQCSNDLAAGCAIGECRDESTAILEEEETALVQTKLQPNRRQAELEHNKFPDLGNLTHVIGEVADAVTGVAASAIVSAMDGVRTELERMEDEIAPYAKMADEDSKILQEGLESIFGQAFGVTIEGSSEGSQMKANKLLDQIEIVWRKVSSSLKEVSTLVDSLLSLMGSSADGARNDVNSTVQGILDTTNSVIDAVELVDKAIKTIDAVAHVPQESLSLSSLNNDSFALLEANQTKTDPLALLNDLNEAVTAVTDKVSSFGHSLSDMFDSILNSTEGILKDLFPSDEYRKVAASFADVEKTANDLANEVVGATNDLFGSVSKASVAASDAIAAADKERDTQRSGAGPAWRRLSRRNLSVVAAAAVAAMGV